jgi:hypothetical protein
MESTNPVSQCPVRGDYRLFTDWRPRCSTQYSDMIRDRLPSALDYRNYMIANAAAIMQTQRMNAYNLTACGPCDDAPSWNQGTVLPETDTQTCNARTCSFKSSDPWGVGRHRSNTDPTPNDEFLASRERHNEELKRLFDEAAKKM